MPFTINVTPKNPQHGLIRTSIFTKSNNDLSQLRGTMLLAKLNQIHLGVFTSGKMRDEYETINNKKPHAETNLIQALKDTEKELPLYLGADNILSIKLSKSPCGNCTESLIAFYESFCIPRKIKVRIKIMKIHEKHGIPFAVNNIAKLQQKGIICVPWHLEGRFELRQNDKGEKIYVSKKKESKSKHMHELSEQVLTEEEYKLMKDRTTKLSKEASTLNSKEQYRAVRKELDKEQAISIAKEISGRLTQVNLRILDIQDEILHFMEKDKKFNDLIARENERIANFGKEASIGSKKRASRQAAITPYSKREKDYKNAKKKVVEIGDKFEDLESALESLTTQKEFLQYQINELNKIA